MNKIILASASPRRKELLMNEGIDFIIDASSIDEKLEPTEDFHRFGMPEPGVCLFYHRDRSEPEEDTCPAIYTREELLRSFYNSYIFEDGHWTAYKGGEVVN